jgi:hypothetical protein
MILPDPRFQIDVAESEADRSSPPSFSSASADAKSTEHIRAPQASDFSTAAKALAGVEQFPAELLSPDTRVSLSISAFFTHSLSDCAVQPILAAIEVTVAHREG